MNYLKKIQKNKISKNDNIFSDEKEKRRKIKIY